MKQQYCRACGTGRGHTFASCKNLRAIKRIVESQDGELTSALQQLKTVEEARTRLLQDQTTGRFFGRVVAALLDLAEAKREEKR